jgi:hypothetical protein
MEMIQTFRDEKQGTSRAADLFDAKTHPEPEIDASLR